MNAARATTGEGGRSRVAAAVGLAVLVGCCFGPALFGGGQFAFRDAGHYYYPLDRSAHRQWEAGHLPLWEPGEDGGRPLLGSPQAAVLYPGKLIQAAIPDAWGSKIYILSHVLLAFATMWSLARWWEISPDGSTLAGFAYAFGGPVLFQYCNPIYLVGAAWAPLGFRGADGWLRLGRRSGPIVLALALSMQALGGDLEAAYLTALASAGYGVALSLRRPRFRTWALAAAVALLGWASLVASLGPNIAAIRSGPARLAVAVCWSIGLLVCLARGFRGRERSPLGARMLGLAGAGALALALGAAQLGPVAMNLVESGRWDEAGRADPEDFSLEPYRSVEWALPNAFGSMIAGERAWLRAIPAAVGHRVWVPSLYLGGLPLALALGAFGFRGGSAWRGWLSAVLVLGFLASCGKFVDPSAWIGSSRGGSVYQLMAAALPGFSGFRYPSKILVFVSLAMAGLAGAGWERVAEGSGKRSTAWASLLLVLTLAGLAAAVMARSTILESLGRSPIGQSGSLFGPFDLPGIHADLVRNLGHAAIASALALGVILLARRRHALAGSAAVVFLAVDLAAAGSGLFFTLPQADLDRPAEASRLMKQDAGEATSTRGRRAFRMPAWTPTAWDKTGSPTRAAEHARWERATLFPLYGLLDGIDAMATESGTVESGEFEAFFAPYLVRVDARVAATIGVTPGSTVVGYPRRALDLWGVCYFLLPVEGLDGKQGNRALASFLEKTEPVDFQRPDSPAPADFQIRRNLAAMPRAWVVHDFVALDPGSNPEATRLAKLAAQYLARGPSSRPIPKSLEIDPRASALIETDAPGDLDRFRSAGPPSPTEVLRIERDEPSRVEISVTLERPGLVVLADRFDSGWKATVNGSPSAVLKANALMRATAVGAGSHRVIHQYDPASFRVGRVVSLIGMVALVGAFLWARRDRPLP